MPVRTKPASCQGCPAYHKGKGFVPPTIPANLKYLFMGSGPTSDEFLDGEPFSGFVGRRLDYWLAKSGIGRHECALGHVVQCQLPYEKGRPRDPAKAEVAHCREAHWNNLTELNVDVMVTLGVPAGKALINPKFDSNDIGNAFGYEFASIGIQTPSYITGGNWAEEPAQIEFLKHAKDLADGKASLDGRPDFTQPPPGIQFKASPGLNDLREFSDKLSTSDYPKVVVDIETAGDHIRLVGLYDPASRSYLGFPIRSTGGGNYWGPSDLPDAIGWLWDLLADPAIGKTFHNGQAFDVPVLERNGFEVRGFEFDTMLGMHVAYPGVPKGLEELSKVHLRAGGWKSLVKIDDEDGEGK